MDSPKKKILAALNRCGQMLPKRIQRFIVDFPGILKLLEKLSRDNMQEIRTPEGQRLMINPMFHSNLIHTVSLGKYEPVIRKSILQLTRPGMTAYDIGANVGVFSFLFAAAVHPEGIVYAFEPERINYTCLDKSIIINNCKNIILDQRAVGKSRGKEQFDRRGGAFSGRLVGNNVSYNKTDNMEIIETVSIDYLIKEESYQVPDIIKIDVEGNEGLVIEGMRHTLASHHPIIICELHTHLGESGRDIIESLINHGYCITDAGNKLPVKFMPETDTAMLPTHIIAIKQ